MPGKRERPLSGGTVDSNRTVAIILQPSGCYLVEAVMGFPDRIERTVPIVHPPEKVWAALARAGMRSAPMQVAQQFLAALARDWDGPLDALRGHLSR